MIGIILATLLAIKLQTNSDTAPDGIPFVVAEKPWAVDGLGNHRAVVEVTDDSHFARVVLPWRRHDDHPERKGIVVLPLDGVGSTLPSRIEKISEETGTLIFSPKHGVSRYAIYYMPFKFDRTEGWTDTKYMAPIQSPQHGVDQWDGPISEAKVIRFEARSDFDSFAPMELAATEDEVGQIRAKLGTDYGAFVLDRQHPVRMFDRLPYMLTHQTSGYGLLDTARPNEYFTYQIAVTSFVSDLRKAKISFSPMRSRAGDMISPGRITCFNLGGTNWDGSKLVKLVSIGKGKVYPFWIGVDIAEHQKPGTYLGTAKLNFEGQPSKTVRISLTVEGRAIADRGDSDLWRYSRLRWLNSTLGTNDEPVAPYGPLQVFGKPMWIAGSYSKIQLGIDGLPEQLFVNNKPVLEHPITLGPRIVNSASMHLAGKGRAIWQSKGETVQWSRVTTGEYEFDGHGDIHVRFTAKQDTIIPGLRLSVPYRKDASRYFMGIGHPGGFRPEHYQWDWVGPYDSWWMGNVDRGAQIELRGATYNGPLLNLYHPQPAASWFNGGKGTVSVDGSTVTAYGGDVKLKKGQTVDFEFAFLTTPVKPINTAWQFATRFYHNGADYTPTPTAIAAGANVVNIHHANDINPYINYPFRNWMGLKAFIQKQHLEGRKVKIYDTIRELSNYTAEIWPLLAMDNEFFVPGGGGGFAWLQEHVGTNYVPSWYHPYPVTGTADASIVTTGFSRLINYYIEGLAWLAKSTQMDGLYLDDVSFDRRVLKRMRRVLASGGRQPMIDLHSNTGFSIGPANQYAEFLPYIDRQWFGESFDYNQMSADRWIVETSGIPFGLMGEMLQGGGNRWLGMVYGMTTRFGWTNYEIANNPDPIWRFWDQFGIAKSKMVGYWDPNSPVHTDQESVKATAYIRKDKVLIAVGNFGDKDIAVNLKINWKTLGLDPKKVSLNLPKIQYYQDAAEFKVGTPIHVPAKKGWLIVVN